MNDFTIAGHIANVYKFSGPHFIETIMSVVIKLLFFNGGWAVLDTLLINSLIHKFKKIKDNFRVYLECAQSAFLTA